MNKLILGMTAAMAMVSSFASYTELEYIQGTGSAGKQWIHSGFTPEYNTRIEVKFQPYSASDAETLFCAQASSSADMFTCYHLKNNQMRVWYGDGCYQDSSPEYVSLNQDSVIVVDGATHALAINGVNCPAFYKNKGEALGSFTVGSPMSLFAAQSLGANFTNGTATSSMSYFSSYRFYYLRAYDAEGNLVADFRPARDDAAEDGSVAQYGVYDRVAGAFRPNCGNAAFVAGPVLAGSEGTLVIANDAPIAIAASATVPAAGSHVYGDGEAVACSAAPCNNVADTIRATPTGYTLETLDRTAGLWSTPVYHAGTSYDYTQSGTDAVRLTWKWTTAAAPAVLTPIRDGLQYRLDASDKSSMTINDNDYVTEWRSNLGDIDICYSNKLMYAPFYKENAFGDGLPGVVFGLNKDGTRQHPTYWYTSNLIANRATTNATLILVLKMSVNYPSMVYFWGPDQGTSLYGGSSDTYSVQANYGISGRDLYFCGEKKWKTGETVKSYYNFGFNAPTWIYASRTDALIYSAVALGNSKRNYDNSSEGPRCIMGPVAELLIWKRPLTDAERLYMDEYVRRKWIRKSASPYWTGKGENKSWSNLTNWSPSVTLASSNHILENADAVIDSDLSVSSFLSFGSTKIAVTNATLSGSFNQLSAASLTFSGSVGLSVASGKQVAMPTNLTLTAGTTLVKCGEGTLTMSEDRADSEAVLQLEQGLVDLNGTRQEYVKVTGRYATITNTGDEAGTLVVNTGAADHETELSTRVAGNVRVERIGEGTLNTYGMFDNTAGTALAAGKTAVSTAMLPAIPGCTLHLDASDLTSIDTNENGYVTCWRSIANTNMQFEKHDSYVGSDESKQPYYDATAFGGRGAISFGYNRVSKSAQMSYLIGRLSGSFMGGTKLPVQTHFIVQRLRGFPQWSTPFGTHYADQFLYRGSSDAWTYPTFGTYNCGSGDVWVNGERLYSAIGGVTYSHPKLSDNYSKYGVFGLIVKNDFPKMDVDDMLTAVRRSDVYKFGNSSGYYVCVGGEVGYTRYHNGWIAEAIFYDHQLSDEEFLRVQRYLMDKWGVSAWAGSSLPRAGGAFNSATTLELSAGTTLDLGLEAATQAVAKVTVDGSATVTNGVLASSAYDFTYDAAGEASQLTAFYPLDLSSITVGFRGISRSIKPGKFLLAPLGLTGDFAAVDWGEAKPSVVRVKPKYAAVGIRGTVIILR